jgi:hypothetical protein
MHIEDQINQLKEDIIPIFDYLPDNYLKIKRIKHSGLYRTEISIDDDTQKTNFKLGYLTSGKWVFEDSTKSSLFWSLIKKKKRSKHLISIINKMKSVDGVGDTRLISKLKWKERKRKIRKFIRKYITNHSDY